MKRYTFKANICAFVTCRLFSVQLLTQPSIQLLPSPSPPPLFTALHSAMQIKKFRFFFSEFIWIIFFLLLMNEHQWRKEKKRKANDAMVVLYAIRVPDSNVRKMPFLLFFFVPIFRAWAHFLIIFQFVCKHFTSNRNSKRVGAKCIHFQKVNYSPGFRWYLCVCVCVLLQNFLFQCDAAHVMQPANPEKNGEKISFLHWIRS